MRWFFAALLFCLVASQADAHARHHYRHYRPHVHRYHSIVGGLGHGLVHMLESSKMCHESTAGGEITVSCDSFAQKIKGFIADVVARGFKGRIHCFSLSPRHVSHSLHKIGHACDFAQRGWGKTVPPMYHVRDLTAKWGLRDGCTFRDCGHIDAGLAYTARHLRHYAGAG